VSHPKVAEAAVVGMPHPIKGEGIYAFVTLKNRRGKNRRTEERMVAWVRKQIGPLASPDKFSSPTVYPRPEAVKSCAVFSPVFPPVISRIWAIPAPWPTIGRGYTGKRKIIEPVFPSFNHKAPSSSKRRGFCFSGNTLDSIQ